jgi:hypothetical protein
MARSILEEKVLEKLPSILRIGSGSISFFAFLFFVSFLLHLCMGFLR